MGFFDRLFGRKPQPVTGQTRPFDQQPQQSQPPSEDERAVARYRYMLQTAPPEQIEQAHAEAFARLTPEQRSMMLQQLGDTLPAGERPTQDDPRSLARAATRAEMRQPGTLERTFGGRSMGGGMGGGMGGMGMGMGGLMAGSFLSTMAGAFVGTAIAQQFFDNDTGFADSGFDQDGGGGEGDAGPIETGSEDGGYGTDAGDGGGFDNGGFGGGGDFGGGDFGGGDFGGGDFGGGDF